MKLYIASDKHGWIMKNEIVKHLKGTNHTYSVEDLGPTHEDTVDAICYAFFLAKVVVDDQRDLGIFISKTGNEVMIPMNRSKYTRACLCFNKDMAKVSKKDINANILVLPSEVVIPDNPLDIVDTWLETKYDGNNMNNVRKNRLMDM